VPRTRVVVRVLYPNLSSLTLLKKQRHWRCILSSSRLPADVPSPKDVHMLLEKASIGNMRYPTFARLLRGLAKIYPANPAYQLDLGRILTFDPSTRLDGARLSRWACPLILLAIALSTVPPKGPDAPVLTPAQTTQDVGFGVCPAFSHYHAYDPSDPTLDGICHRDSDDSVIDDTPRRELPKP
jgi:hypothetical protein